MFIFFPQLSTIWIFIQFWQFFTILNCLQLEHFLTFFAAWELLWRCWHFRQLRTSIHDNHNDLTLRVTLDSICNSWPCLLISFQFQKKHLTEGGKCDRSQKKINKPVSYMAGQVQQFQKFVVRYWWKRGIEKIEFEQQKDRTHLSKILVVASGGMNHRKAYHFSPHGRAPVTDVENSMIFKIHMIRWKEDKYIWS